MDNAPARTEAIVEWLLERADRIDGAAKVKLTFNCRGRSIVPVVEEFWDADCINIDN